MKSFLFVVLGVAIGMGVTVVGNAIMALDGSRYGVFRENVSICQILQTGCSPDEDFGGFSQGTPYELRGDHVLLIGLRINPGNLREKGSEVSDDDGQRLRDRFLFSNGH